MKTGSELYIVFFFQAEDGIRDGHVTGVQTCALPICAGVARTQRPAVDVPDPVHHEMRVQRQRGRSGGGREQQIGRASCRERGEISVGAGEVKQKEEKKQEKKGSRHKRNEKERRRDLE